MSRRRVPWDGPHPAPGDYLAGRSPGQCWRIAAAVPLRRPDQFGNRLDLDLQPILPEAIPDGSVVHPWVRAQPTIEAGPARVRQLAADGPTAVMRDEWNDPEDMRPRARKPRQITGWRVFDPLRRMADVEPEHRIAAELFRQEVEATQIGQASYDWMVPKISGARRTALPLSQASANAGVARVYALFAPSQRIMLTEIVLLGRSIAGWCRKTDPPRNPSIEAGRLLGILDVLTQYYLTEVEAELAAERAA